MAIQLTFADAFDIWKEEVMPAVIETYGRGDEVALSESWNDFTDGLCKDGQLTDLQYHYCPAWDEGMPDDDAEYLLQAMGFTFDVSSIVKRPDGLMNDNATHWKVWIKRGERLMTAYYSMGSARSGEPDTTDVMGCLLSDTDNIDAGYDFEEWADALGYDTDSRAAERIYNACKQTWAELEPMFTASELTDIRQAFADR